MHIHRLLRHSTHVSTKSVNVITAMQFGFSPQLALQCVQPLLHVFDKLFMLPFDHCNNIIRPTTGAIVQRTYPAKVDGCGAIVASRANLVSCTHGSLAGHDLRPLGDVM